MPQVCLGQHLLSGAPGVRCRPKADAPDREVTHRVSLRGQPDVTGPAGAGRVKGEPVTRLHTDEAAGNRGHVSQAQHLKTLTGPKDLSLPALETAG